MRLVLSESIQFSLKDNVWMRLHYADWNGKCRWLDVVLKSAEENK